MIAWNKLRFVISRHGQFIQDSLETISLVFPRPRLRRAFTACTRAAKHLQELF